MEEVVQDQRGPVIDQFYFELAGHRVRIDRPHSRISLNFESYVSALGVERKSPRVVFVPDKNRQVSPTETHPSTYKAVELWDIRLSPKNC